jgi:chromosome segregation ATPase
MADIVKWVLGVLIAVMLFGGGYGLGSRKVAALEAQIDKIKDAGESAEARSKRTQAEIDKALKEKEAEHARQAQQLKAEADRKEKELAAALAGTRGRVESLQSQLSAAQAKQAQLGAGTDAATAAERRRLQAQIEALKSGVDANQCLALAVPEAVIGPVR